MRYLFVMVGRNCEPWAEASVLSVARQSEHHNIAVCVVDDASDDLTAKLAGAVLDDFGFESALIVNDSRRGAMANQWEAWHLLEPQADDVVVWVDLDDRLEDIDVCSVLDRYYARGATMSYGSYRSEPFSKTCAPAQPYPAHVARAGKFRDLRVAKGLLFNHLRSVGAATLAQITEEDCRDDDGEWWSTGPDAAVMLPALELSRDRYAFVRETLLVYTSNVPAAEWRCVPDLVNRNHRQMLARSPRGSISRPRPLSRAEQVRARRARRNR